VRFRDRKRAGGSFAVLAYWTAREGEEDEVERVLRRLASASRREAGCISYSAHRSVDDPSRYVIYERYVDEQAFQRHTTSEHFRALVLEDGIARLASRTRESYSVIA
jgi:quinol monooxygenase YgiN